MGKASKMNWGEGSRRLQPIYQRDKETGKITSPKVLATKKRVISVQTKTVTPDGETVTISRKREDVKVEKRVPLYQVWTGYDWLNIDRELEPKALALGLKIEKQKRFATELKIKVLGTAKRGETRDDLSSLLEKKRNEIMRQILGGSESQLFLAEYESNLHNRTGGELRTIVSETPTLNEVVDRWFASGDALHLSFNTLRKYRGFHEKFIKLQVSEDFPVLGEMIMAEITKETMQFFDAALRVDRIAQVKVYNKKTKETTIEWQEVEYVKAKNAHDLFAWLKQIWKFAMDDDQRQWTCVKSNRLDKVNLRDKDEDAKARVLYSKEEMIALMSKAVEIGDDQIAALMALVASATDRPNALTSLTWDKYDDEKQGFRLDGQFINNKWTKLKNKEKGVKFIALPDSLLPLVLASRSYSKWVVPVSKSEPHERMRSSTWYDRFKKILEQDGMPKHGSIYNFKHSTATELTKDNTADDVSIFMSVSKKVAMDDYVDKSVKRAKMVKKLWDEKTVEDK